MKLDVNDPSSWAVLSPYLDQALDLAPEQHEQWLSELARTQPDVAQTLRELLRVRDELNDRGFLEGSLHSSAPSSGEWVGSRADVAQGTTVGPYTLLREIGQGGMSSVWLAQRSDGAVKRQIALKLPFVGPERLRLVDRFKRECDILATLTHPNIARLYDAGLTSSGQPYLAMEYVEGTTLTRYCDEQRLSIRERLKVFLQALAAVEFAHEQLVLHRDLKPSNILVTPQGRVVLLDFGIAKVLTEQAAQPSLLTEVMGRILTPDYAAPEHISGRVLSITSDVYSLGVVLYELLAGTRPFGVEHESRHALEAAILTHDPSRPSHCTFTEQIAAARHTTARRLARTLAGDLDTIVLKSLKKAPGERYRSIAPFAEDIGNYLEQLPVRARPDSAWYRLRRFVSRHTLTVAAASIALAAILGGSMIAVWQAHKAGEERNRALALADRNLALASRNEAVNDFTEMLLTEAAASSKPVTVSEILERSEKLALADSSGKNEDRAAILEMIASRYQSLGDSGRAAKLLERALALVERSSDSELRSELVCVHAYAMNDLGQSDAAVSAITHELEILNPEHGNAAGCLLYRSLIAERLGDAQGALSYALRSLDNYRLAADVTPSNEATVLGAVARGYQMVGQNEQASHYYELAVQEFAAIGRDGGPNAINVRGNWASISFNAGDPRNALQIYDQMLSLQGTMNQNVSAAIVYNRARVLEMLGRYQEARDGYERCVPLAEQQKHLFAQVYCQFGLGSLAERAHDAAAAAKYLDLGQKPLGPDFGPTSPPMLTLADLRGRLAQAQGNLDDARAQYQRALAKKSSSRATVEAEIDLAELELQSGDPAAAETQARTALELATSMQAGNRYSSYAGLSQLALSQALRAQGKLQEARTMLDNSLAHLSNTLDPDHPALVQARQLLAASK